MAWAARSRQALAGLHAAKGLESPAGVPGWVGSVSDADWASNAAAGSPSAARLSARIGEISPRPARLLVEVSLLGRIGRVGSNRHADVMVSLDWPVQADNQLQTECHRVIAAVVEQGGAVGWLRVPSRQTTDAWLDHVLGAAESTGRGGLVVARVHGRIEAFGVWLAGPPGPVGRVAELTKIMAHPDARGIGLGKRVVFALVDACANAGIEVITLGVRGNNHGAIALYEACGFRTWGVLPNAVAVGDLRFDDVRMFRPLALPAGARIHGSAAGGPGASAARKA